jgi:hypothetical protein
MQQHRIDPFSPTWLAIKAHVETELMIKQSTVNTPLLPLAETENARGAIQALNSVLSLASTKNAPVLPQTSE